MTEKNPIPFPDATEGRELRPPVPDRMWTAREVAAFLQIGKNAPADLVRRGELSAARIGRRLRFDPAQVRAFAVRCAAVPLAPRRGVA